MTGMGHIGRSWPGDTHLEDACPCEKAPCGLAIADSNPDCPEHGMGYTKTLRQWHDNEDCPGTGNVKFDPFFPRPGITFREFGHDD